MNKRLSPLLAALLLTLRQCATAWPAAPEGAVESILQQELKQQQLQRTTQRVAQQLEVVIVEFENNGLSGEDLRTLRAIRGVLGRLSETEMAQVIALLTQARSAPDAASSRQSLTAAYSGEKTIITLLKQLLLEYERQQALYELSQRFRELAGRQSRQMRAGLRIERGSPQGDYNEEQRLALQVQQVDQVQLRNEVGILLGRLTKFASENEGALAGERLAAAARRVREGGMVGALDAAAETLKSRKVVDLGGRKVLAATSHQKIARDEMREVARLLLLSKDSRDLLRTAISETEAALIQQRQAIQETARIQRREDALAVEERQAEALDAADLVRRDVQQTAPVAADHLRDASDRMQEARDFLVNSDGADKKRRETTPRQQEAAKRLEMAQKALQQQLDKAESEAGKPEDRLAHLEALQQEVRKLADRQETLERETAQAENKPKDLRAKAPLQGNLKDKTQEARQTASEQAPVAVKALTQAMDEMGQAQTNLAKGQSPSRNQQAAVDALKEADRQTGQEISRLQQAGRQLAALEKLSATVGSMIQEQELVNLDTGKEAAGDAASAGSPQNLAQREKTLGAESGRAQREAAQSAPAAAPHLAEAAAEMNKAAERLAKPDAASAQAAEKKALSELLAARQELDRQRDGLRRDLGQADDSPGQSLADAVAAIEKAQGHVNQALGRMADAPPGLVDSLAKEEQGIAAALGEKAREDVSPQLNQAWQAAAGAAEQLSRGDLPRAIDQMEKAENAIRSAGAGESKLQGEPPVDPGRKQDPQSAPTPVSLPRLGQQQATIRDRAAALLAAQQAVPPAALEAAAQDLGGAAKDVAPVAAGEKGQLPAAALVAVHSALDSLNEAAAQASGHHPGPAQAGATVAAQALAQARAALTLAESGLSSDISQAPPGKQPPSGQQPGQGKTPGQAAAPAGERPPGQGQQPGQGPQAAQTPPSPKASPEGTGRVGNWNGPGGDKGPLKATAGSGQFLGLPSRDRAAVQQSRSENYPQEYGPMIEQYLKNLSDQTGKK